VKGHLAATGIEESSLRAPLGRGSANTDSTAARDAREVEVSLRSELDLGASPRGADPTAAPDAPDANVRVSLDTLVRLIERVAPGMRGSVLLLDDDGVTLRHGAAPGLPEAYCRLIDGQRIGPIAGSCGTAAYRRERVIVRDIASDPLWENYRQVAEPFHLAACWSTPILGPEERVLGTFAMYYSEPREPTPDDIVLTETAALLAANIILRARAMAEARIERERLYKVFMQAPAAISVLEGPEHVATVVNPLYRELIGNRDIIGRRMRDAFPELIDRGLLDVLDRVYSSGEPYSARERLLEFDRDGDGVPEEYYSDFVYQPLKDVSGRPFGIVVHAVDVTSQVRARQEIAAAHAEAKRANKAKSEFLAAMSHDLRTPLNAIGGYADLAADGVFGPITEQQRNAMARIRRAGNHLLTLINDILNFAKVEAGRVHFEITDVPVSELVASAGAMIEVEAAAKGISLEVRRGADRVRARVDRERTVQILTNLLTNAVKFTDAGSITVDWQADDRAVRVDVRDTGRGIPADRLDAVFEPFVQAGRSAEERQQGVGLGLAISRELARAMGGDVTVESEVAQGSTFRLAVPRAADA
jgi:signal transduction histidine kinase